MNRSCSRLLPVATLALLGTACDSTKQKVTFGDDALKTPAHHMSRADYPFDDGGHYVDAWAAEGAARYPASHDSDSHDRADRSTAPPANPKKVAATPPAKPGSKATTKPPAKPGPKPPTKPSSKITIKVKHGDTLTSLGRKYGVSPAAIKKANGLSSDVLRDGRSLVIPK